MAIKTDLAEKAVARFNKLGYNQKEWTCFFDGYLEGLTYAELVKDEILKSDKHLQEYFEQYQKKMRRAVLVFIVATLLNLALTLQTLLT